MMSHTNAITSHTYGHVTHCTIMWYNGTRYVVSRCTVAPAQHISLVPLAYDPTSCCTVPREWHRSVVQWRQNGTSRVQWRGHSKAWVQWCEHSTAQHGTVSPAWHRMGTLASAQRRNLEQSLIIVVPWCSIVAQARDIVPIFPFSE